MEEASSAQANTFAAIVEANPDMEVVVLEQEVLQVNERFSRLEMLRM